MTRTNTNNTIDKQNLQQEPPQNLQKKSALQFVILLGLVSLFSDMVYEGSRSVVGPLFSLLGASGAVVGFVAGFGELVGNALRIFSGMFIDRTAKYWLITFLGYGCLFAIPLLAFAHSWKIAALLIIAERVGKAIRTPARDAMLSYATQKIGRGVGFGLHQVFDQIGGMLGPLLMIIVLVTHHNYALGFSFLFIPACIALIVLMCGKKLYPSPQNLEVSVVEPADITTQKIPRQFWILLCAACLMAAGYADFPLIAFHFAKEHLLPALWIPIFYIIAMGVSAISALFFGWIYDRAGTISLMIAILLSAFYAPCVFFDGYYAALAGMFLWGIGMGAQRSLLKAIVSSLISKNLRGTAFGIFNTAYGIAWFLGSWLMGFLYDASIHAVVIFSIAAELAAIPFIYALIARGG